MIYISLGLQDPRVKSSRPFIANRGLVDPEEVMNGDAVASSLQAPDKLITYSGGANDDS